MGDVGGARECDMEHHGRKRERGLGPPAHFRDQNHRFTVSGGGALQSKTIQGCSEDAFSLMLTVLTYFNHQQKSKGTLNVKGQKK